MKIKQQSHERTQVRQVEQQAFGQELRKLSRKGRIAAADRLDRQTRPISRLRFSAQQLTACRPDLAHLMKLSDRQSPNEILYPPPGSFPKEKYEQLFLKMKYSENKYETNLNDVLYLASSSLSPDIQSHSCVVESIKNLTLSCVICDFIAQILLQSNEHYQ
ncbi:Endolysin [Trichinella pseudospiralis]